MADQRSPLQWYPSKLVLLRLWFEQNGDGREQLCGKVQFVVSGEAHYFQGGEALVELLSEMLRHTGAPITDGAGC